MLPYCFLQNERRPGNSFKALGLIDTVMYQFGMKKWCKNKSLVIKNVTNNYS